MTALVAAILPFALASLTRPIGQATVPLALGLPFLLALPQPWLIPSWYAIALHVADVLLLLNLAAVIVTIVWLVRRRVWKWPARGAASLGLVLITVPPGGLVPNVVSPGAGLIAAQVGSSNTFGTTLINLTIDGTDASCAGVDRTAGIAFANIGDKTYDTFGGTIQQVVVRNQYGCGTSDGIIADNSFITVTANVIHDIAANGINQIGGNSNTNNNTLQICNVSGIVLSGVTGATVNANVLSNNQYGIRLDSPNNVTVSNNTLGPWVGTAIYVVNGLNTGITGNKIKSSWAGIWLTASAGAIVRLNNINRTAIFALGHTFSAGANTFTNNTITESRFGIYAYNPAAVTVADAMVPNTFLSVKQTTTADPWVPE